MRIVPTLPLTFLLLSACGIPAEPRTRGTDAAALKAAGERCTSHDACAMDHACVGCSPEDDRDRVCVRGCASDADCSVGSCKEVQCVRCPCPGQCQE